MNEQIIVGEERGALSLIGDWTIFSVGKLKQTLLDAVGASEDIRLDMTGVSDFDAAGMQLLWLIRRQAVSQNRGFSIARASEPVRQALERVDLATTFGLPAKTTQGGAP